MRRAKTAADTCLALAVGAIAAGVLLWSLAGGTIVAEAKGLDGPV